MVYSWDSVCLWGFMCYLGIIERKLMYKDKDKQRDANAERQRRYKANQKALLNEGVTEGVTDADREQIKKDMVAIGLKPVRTLQGNIRVSKPGDDDYVPMCETTRAFIEGRDKRPESGKRGKDIKCFEDLPPDVQLSIDLMDIGPEEKKRRTAIAVNYQHQFPGRFHSTGVT